MMSGYNPYYSNQMTMHTYPPRFPGPALNQSNERQPNFPIPTNKYPHGQNENRTSDYPTNPMTDYNYRQDPNYRGPPPFQNIPESRSNIDQYSGRRAEVYEPPNVLARSHITDYDPTTRSNITEFNPYLNNTSKVTQYDPDKPPQYPSRPGVFNPVVGYDSSTVSKKEEVTYTVPAAPAYIPLADTWRERKKQGLDVKEQSQNPPNKLETADVLSAVLKHQQHDEETASNDPTILNILKSIGFDFELSRKTQEKAKKEREAIEVLKKTRTDSREFGIQENDTSTFLGSNIGNVDLKKMFLEQSDRNDQLTIKPVSQNVRDSHENHRRHDTEAVAFKIDNFSDLISRPHRQDIGSDIRDRATDGHQERARNDYPSQFSNSDTHDQTRPKANDNDSRDLLRKSAAAQSRRDVRTRLNDPDSDMVDDSYSNRFRYPERGSSESLGSKVRVTDSGRLFCNPERRNERYESKEMSRKRRYDDVSHSISNDLSYRDTGYDYDRSPINPAKREGTVLSDSKYDHEPRAFYSERNNRWGNRSNDNRDTGKRSGVSDSRSRDDRQREDNTRSSSDNYRSSIRESDDRRRTQRSPRNIERSEKKGTETDRSTTAAVDEKKNAPRLTESDLESLHKEREERRRRLSAMESQLQVLKRSQEKLGGEDKNSHLAHESRKLEVDIIKAIQNLKKTIDSNTKKIEEALAEKAAKSSKIEPSFELKKLWCSFCLTNFSDLDEMFHHFNTSVHSTNFNTAQRELDQTIINEASKAKLDVSAIQGSEFLQRVDGYFCNLCKIYIHGRNAAEHHIRSERHNREAKDFCWIFPTYQRFLKLDHEMKLEQMGKEACLRIKTNHHDSRRKDDDDEGRYTSRGNRESHRMDNSKYEPRSREDSSRSERSSSHVGGRRDDRGQESTPKRYQDRGRSPERHTSSKRQEDGGRSQSHTPRKEHMDQKINTGTTDTTLESQSQSSRPIRQGLLPLCMLKRGPRAQASGQKEQESTEKIEQRSSNFNPNGKGTSKPPRPGSIPAAVVTKKFPVDPNLDMFSDSEPTKKNGMAYSQRN